jgi:CRISPR-associated endonuclease/helicase Cas3
VTLLDRFGRFYAAVNGGDDPYPWQEELVSAIAKTGCWPSAIHRPTGAGKSFVVDAHVFLVAERERMRGEASGCGVVRRPPRRLVLVAPRRVLVEDQYERATRLADRLAWALHDEEDTIVGEVARLLQQLLTTDEPLDRERPLGVARLRGGVRLDHTWRLDPSRCQVVCATPQMWGSRLLARGFRSSRRSRNLETGLLANDVVAIVDEAHLHERLVETAGRIAAAQRSPLGIQLVAMSATRAQTATDGDGLSEADLADPRLRRRVNATKRIELVEVDNWRDDALGEIVVQAQRLACAGTVGVFVNTVSMAIAVAAALEGTVALVCGRMRPADVARLRSDWDGLLDARGNDEVDYLVATQSLEVGVDLDLPAVVTAIAPASALAQRAGRLNRNGRYDDATFAVVAPRGLAAAEPEAVRKVFRPYDGKDVVAAAGWLAALDGDASPAQISATPLPESSPTPLPSLTRVELETLAMTGHALAADPDVSFYVEEPRDRQERFVLVGARYHLDLGEEVVGRALLAVPPRAHELAAIPAERAADVIDAAPGSWRMWNERGRLSVEPIVRSTQVASGDVVIVPAGSRVCTAGVIGAPGRRTAEPIEEVMSARPDGATPDAIVRLPVEGVVPIREADPTLGGRDARHALAEITRDRDRELADRLRRRRLSDLAVTWCADEDRPEGLLVVVATEREGDLPATAVGSTAEPITVDAHGTAVEARMTRILDALDLEGSGDLGVDQAQLLAAARWHDEGKRHPRFQRRMGAPPDGPALAKPAPGHKADEGDGWHHEQLSAAFTWVLTAGDATPTVIGTGHHGNGQPLFDRDADALLGDWDACDPAIVEAAQLLFGSSGRYELERARLQRSLGVHGLAYLEALLRCADMQVSREGS